MSKRLQAIGLVTLLLATGCDSSTEPEDTSWAGTYTLVRLNGFPLPISLDEEETEIGLCTETLTGGTLALDADAATWQAALLFTVSCVGGPGGPISQNDSLQSSGTFTRSGNTFAFMEAGQDPFSGVRAGNTFTINTEVDEGLVLILEFTKD